MTFDLEKESYIYYAFWFHCHHGGTTAVSNNYHYVSSDSDVIKMVRVMFRSELETFLAKFHQLWKDGYSAHLDVDAHAGQAWVGLRVMLGPCH